MSVVVILTDDIAAAQAVRHSVFVVEQGISLADEIDGRDEDALHLLALDGQTPIGVARILIESGKGKIGRVAVLAERRGEGSGKALVRAAVEVLRDRGASLATLGAQSHATGFYAELGFEIVGPEFMDAGIPHREMVLTL